MKKVEYSEEKTEKKIGRFHVSSTHSCFLGYRLQSRYVETVIGDTFFKTSIHHPSYNWSCSSHAPPQFHDFESYFAHSIGEPSLVSE